MLTRGMISYAFGGKWRAISLHRGFSALVTSCAPLGNVSHAAQKPRLKLYPSQLVCRNLFGSDTIGAGAGTDGPTVRITFVEEDLEDGERIEVDVPLGKKLVDAALDADVDIEAACGGELACSTCHCVFTDQALFDSLPPKQEEEEDMLDLAAGLTPTSRLSCQLEATASMQGAVIVVPGEGL